MNHGRTCEIDEAAVAKDRPVIGAKGAPPGPVREDWIDEARQEDRSHHIRPQTHAFGDRAGNDRCGRAAEHDLKDEKASFMGCEIAQAKIAPVKPREPDRQRRDDGLGCSEGEHEAHRCEGCNREDEIEQVLLGDVNGVL